MDAFAKQIAFLEQHSNYARRWLSAKPEWRSWLQSMGSQEITLAGIQGLLQSCMVYGLEVEQDEAKFMTDLRLARQKLMLWLAFRDLNGLADLKEVTHSLSHFAELAVNCALTFIRQDLQVRFGVPWSDSTSFEMPMMVVGMGKLGGLELNLSSDIDLIFLYEHEDETRDGPKSLSNHEWFTRMGKR